MDEPKKDEKMFYPEKFNPKKYIVDAKLWKLFGLSFW
jgi:hypothetical protein